MEPSATVSIVVPLYRDVANLDSLFRRLASVIAGLGQPTELVLVDDGSRDGTAERAIQLAREFPYPTLVVRLGRNFGQHPAVFAGMQHTTGDVVVTLDSDLQYPPRRSPDCWRGSPRTSRSSPDTVSTEPIPGRDES